VWNSPAPLDPPDFIEAELESQRDFTADLKQLLASSNVCSKRWIHEQYDSMVQTNTVIGPGGEAGVMRIKGTGNREQGSEKPERGLAMALDGNGRWCWLNPRLGAMHAVAECARKVASSGAVPVAATNCLNFGNPEKPEIMAQLSAAIDGIAEACTALGTPITGGNVSLYNETRGVGIQPTPVLGIVGIIDDVTNAVPSHFQRAGDAIVLLWPVPKGQTPDPNLAVPIEPLPISMYPLPAFEDQSARKDQPDASDADAARNLTSFGSSEFAKIVLGGIWGQPPSLDLDAEARLHKLLVLFAERGIVHSARDISDGGIAVALAQAAFTRSIGATVEQDSSLLAHPLFGLFAEPATTMLLSASLDDFAEVENLASKHGFIAARIGTTGGARLEISVDREPFISAPLSDLRKIWSSSLEANIHEEVPA
jgi:phosphoribosylformylglycinamidine synthase